jgi:hypothetical protein
MNNETSNLYGSENSFEANGPGIEENSSDNLREEKSGFEETESKFKQYGKKSLAPLISLMHKYKSEVDPYFSAIDKGLNGAINAFGEEQNEAEKSVSKWFQEASHWVSGAKEKFQSSSPKELLQFLEEEARKHPGLMFSSSYIAGMAFGRLGRHFGRHLAENKDSLKH